MSPIALWVATLATLLAAAFDLKSRRIPNWLTLGMVVAGFLVQVALSGSAGLGWAVSGLFAAFVPALVFFLLRAMGGGDLKLLAGCGALLGPAVVLQLLLATAVAGGGLALAMVAYRRAWADTGRNVSFLLTHWLAFGPTPCPAVSLGRSRGVTVPYGVAIACGMIFTLAHRLGGL